MPNRSAAAFAFVRSRDAIASGTARRLARMAGMTLLSAMFAAPRMPQRTGCTVECSWMLTARGWSHSEVHRRMPPARVNDWSDSSLTPITYCLVDDDVEDAGRVPSRLEWKVVALADDRIDER